LSRTLNKLPNVTDAERQHFEELARRIVNKLLHDPVHALRKADESHAPAEQYLHAMERLFNLSPPPRDEGGNVDDGNEEDEGRSDRATPPFSPA
jgi:hypothetical protein